MTKKKTKTPKRSAKPAKDEKPELPTPQPVSDPLYAFPARVIGTLLPERDRIPAEFDGRQAWTSFIEWWFARIVGNLGLPADIEFHAKSGLDAQTAFRHVDTCMRSFEPRHQNKIAGCAYLASCFFEKVVVPSEKKEFKSS